MGAILELWLVSRLHESVCKLIRRGETFARGANGLNDQHFRLTCWKNMFYCLVASRNCAFKWFSVI